MKSLKGMTVLVVLAMAISISLIGTTISFAGDDNNRYRNDSSSVFSPGYINAAKYQAEAIVNQQTPKKSLFENIVAYVQSKMAANMEQVKTEKAQVTPKLQQKQSSVAASNKANAITNTALNKIKIGTGIQEKDATGRVVAEIIDGTRHVYVGFDNLGKSTIQSAILIANAGDKVIVKSGTYTGTINIKNGVSLYGGYNENGVRNIEGTPSTIAFLTASNSIVASNITKPTELNGFTINSVVQTYSSTNFTITNNTFNGSGWAVRVVSGPALIKNNTFNGKYGISGNVFTNVLSMNNNFYATYAMMATTASKFTSSNDYFAKNNSVLALGGGSVSVNSQATQRHTQTTAAALTKQDTARAYDSAYRDKFGKFNLSSETVMNIREGKIKDLDALSGIFKSLIKGKDNILSNGAGGIDPAAIAKLLEGSLQRSALSLPQGQISPESMETAMRLASIMKNPTEDQEMMLEGITALLQDTNKVEQEAGQSPELSKAQNDLLQMVANVLLAQAMPDLISKGEVANIKTLFSELNTQKNSIMLEYNKSARPYYDSVIKDMAKNMSMLQVKSILSSNVTKNDLEKLPPSELDKILEKIKNMKSRSFEEEYILQQEAKYRKEYLEPGKEKLQNDMKGMLKEFTGRINNVLKSADKK